MGRTRNRHPFTSTLMWGMTLVVVTACSPTLYPIASGFHAPLDERARSGQMGTWIVWSDHAGVGNFIMGYIQQIGGKVVERAHIQRIFNEQKIRLTHTPDDEANVLHVGQLLGATNVVFAEVKITPESFGQAFINPLTGLAQSQSGTRYQLSVAVRGVRIESGEVRWSGTAHYPRAINNPDQGAVYLAQAAIERAICLVEEGYEWQELSASGGGCIEKKK